jgi:hypothetical protein
MGKLDARLKALEAQGQAQLGFRIFQQDMDDVTVFYEGIDNQKSRPHNKANIGALGAAGWQCIVVTYEDREIEQGPMNHILVDDLVDDTEGDRWN